MAHVEGEIIIHRPVEEVFDFVADERNEPRYNHEMLRCELVTGEPIGKGSRYRAEMSMRGRPVEMIELYPARCRRVRMEIEGRLTFDPVPAGTRMAWSWELHPKGALKLLSPLVARMGARQEERIWAELKQVLETPVART